ncbi:DUF6542 domain-containing protein [Rhodococcus sp. GA1]|uniref:DUF6542 domain-containing protein n=1 Tax=Rhodococcus sp. GA1 TaxID=2942275 RepID=UPI0020CC6DCE|nr:DUF6542 domain-containing protein [Rhodococcus sp. GA1]
MSATQRARSAVPLDMRSLAPTVPGVPWWGAVAIAAGTTLLGVLLDSARGNELTSAFTVFYVLGCVAAVVAVRYRGLFTAMAQPPLLLLLAVPIGQEIVSSASTGGLKDLALNVAYPLVNRFPAMLVATLLALAIGGFRIFVTRQNTGVRARAPRERAKPRAAKTGTAKDRPARAAGDRPTRAANDRPTRRAGRGRPATATPADARRTASGRGTPAAKASVREVADTRSRRRVRPESPTAEQPAPRRTRAPRPADPVQPEVREPRRRPAPEPDTGRPAPSPAPTQGYEPPRVRYRDRYED